MKKAATNFVILNILLSISINGCLPETSHEKSHPHELSIINNNIKLLWSVSEVYTIQNDFTPSISAGYGTVCIMGDTTSSLEKSVICLDGLSGKEKWHIPFGDAITSEIDQDGVYIAYGRSPGVEKYDHQGSLLWSKSFNGTGLIHFYLLNQQVQLDLYPDKFIVLDSTSGDEIEGVNNVESIFKTSTELFDIKTSITSKNPETGDIYWSFETDKIIFQEPLFTDKTIYLKTEKTIGTILAVDRQTGNLKWKTERQVISNVVFIPSLNQIIGLLEDGDLVFMNTLDGNQEMVAEFTNPPFFLNGEMIVGGYEIAYDEINKILFVLLGDSRQLFAIKLQ